MALIWSELSQATVAEVRKVILDSSDRKPEYSNLIASGGRLNASGAIESKIFSPVATVLSANNVFSGGSLAQEIIVLYSDRNGLDAATLGDDDLEINHLWGTRDSFPAPLKPGSVQVAPDGKSIRATYLMTPPGGSWDPLDFGTYSIATVAGTVLSQRQNTPIRSQVIGEFKVRIIDPTVLYVDSYRDSGNGLSLRNAIEVSNTDPTVPRTIILEAGRYTIDIPHQSNPTSVFTDVQPQSFCSSTPAPSGWSDSTNGDFDIQGNLTIVGDSKESSLVDARNLDRVFKVHQDMLIERVFPHRNNNRTARANRLFSVETVVRSHFCRQ